ECGTRGVPEGNTARIDRPRMRGRFFSQRGNMASNGTRERSRLVRVTAYDGLVRAFAVDTTEVVAELRARHDPYPAVTAALGRLATGALLLGSTLKEPHHSITVRVQGHGPAGTLLATANGAGHARGLAANPPPDVDQAGDGQPSGCA